MEPSFWTGRRVLLTGHTGFKGSWLALWLAELGAEVTGYALAPAGMPNLFDQARVGDAITSIVADIRDPERLAAVASAAQPEIVFHLAAQSLVRRSYVSPLETFSVNALGTAHVLEAIRHTPSVRSAVIVTTDKCYENRESIHGYREGDALGGHDPYSSSKACAELISASYRSSFFGAGAVGIATARAGNVIGGGDWAGDRIVPDLVRAALASQRAEVRNPASARPWQHVLDVLQGYVMLAQACHGADGRFAGPWNFGPQIEDIQSVANVADALCTAWGEGAAWGHDVAVQPHETRVLALDSSKARAELDWKPRLDFLRSIQWSVDWYKAHRDGRDLADVTRAQLHRYWDLHD